ncbi:metallophosphoesterase [Stakelama sp. CBK3Z-3]|uniref:Metallophosphoesterase n=1 Tax=Stakelama flava TaxID=2860338 RepID=A0ABS6XI50_9SPHN|nr:metallophosphoesterase [Stakelama flava]
MTRLFHVSDLHFGAEDRTALDWFAHVVATERPDAIIMTGDLTMRARRHEFAAAADWLADLGCPVTVEVGNHDLPYLNPLARLIRPYGRYRAVERMVERPLDLSGVTIVPMRTTARFQLRLNWSKGRVGRGALKQAVEEMAAHDGSDMMLVACHHPLLEPGTRSTSRTRGGAEALEALAKAGAHAVLSGHVHDPFDVAHPVAGRTVRLIGAGTLSERTRDAAPSFNQIVVRDGAIDVRHRYLTEHA